MSILQKKHIWYPLIASILLIVLVVPIVNYYFFSNPWDGMTCDEMIDFSGTPEHQELTMDQHMEFHKGYLPCLEKATT